MWEIYAYGNNLELFQVFNAIAALMNSGNYLGLMKVIGTIAILATVIMGAVGKFEGFQWFLGLIMVYMVLFVPKVNVNIVDRMTAQPNQIVANVPIGVALFGHFTSKLGDFLTTSFETVFALPADLRYQTNGMLFGAQLIKESRTIKVVNGELRKDLNAFIYNCTMYDILDSRITIADLKASNDLWNTMQGTNPGRITTVTPVGTLDCLNAWTDINARLVPEINAAKEHYGRKLNPEVANDAAARALIDVQLPIAFNTLTNIADDATTIIRKNMMINAMNDSGRMMATELNDPAAAQIAIGVAQTQAVQKSTYLIMGKVAESALPKIRNVIQIILLAIFPFTFLMMLMPGNVAGSAIKGYAMGLLWVELWPPLYAILNFVATMDLARRAQAAVTSTDGLSINTADALGYAALTNEAIAGYMVLLIPVIAFYVVKGGEMAMTSLTGSIMGPASGAASRAGEQVATGNYQYGNVSMGNHSFNNAQGNSSNMSYRMTDPGMVSNSDATGTTTKASNGQTYVSNERQYLSLMPSISAKTSQGFSASKAKSLESANTNTANWASKLANGESSTGSWTMDQATNDSKALQVTKSVSDNFHQNNSQQFSKGESNMMATSAGMSIGTGPAKMLGLFNAQAGTNYSVNSSEGKARVSAMQEMQSAMISQGITSSQQYAEGIRKSQAFQDSASSGDELATSAQANYRDAERYQQAYDLSQQMGQDSQSVLVKEAADYLMQTNNIGPDQFRDKMQNNPLQFMPGTENFLRQKVGLMEGSAASMSQDAISNVSSGPSSIGAHHQAGKGQIEQKASEALDNVPDASTKQAVEFNMSQVRQKMDTQETAVNREFGERKANTTEFSDEAKKYWSENNPHAISKRQEELEAQEDPSEDAHDF